MKPRRIKIKILIPVFLGLITILVISLFLGILYQQIYRNSQEKLTASSRAMTLVAAGLLQNVVLESDTQKLANTMEEIIDSEGVLYTAVRDTTGNIIAEARSGGWLAQSVTYKSVALQALGQQQLINQVYENTLITTAPISNGEEDFGTLEIVHNLNRIRQTSLLTILRLSGIGGGFIFLVLIVSSLFTRMATGQMEKIVSAAEQIGEGNLESEVPTSVIDEIALVAKTLERARIELRRLYADLGENLEKLRKQTSYLEATATVARDTTSILDQNELLTRFIQLIQERFDFHQQGIYLVDSAGDWAVLVVASGEGAQELLARNFRIKIGVEGIIGHVIKNGEPYLSRNVLNDPYYLSLTETKDVRSELVLPLKSRDEIIGALDIQSKNLDAFPDELVTVLQTLADQFTLAVGNAKLFQQAQENYENLQRAYGEFGRDAWQGFINREWMKGYYCNQDGITQISGIPEHLNSNGFPMLEIPITIRGGQVIGKIRARKPSSGADWTQDEIAVMESLIEQLGVALDSARLYQETQITAQREQAISAATTRIRETLDIETILKTASEEIRKALDLPEVTIHLGKSRVDGVPGS